MASAAGDVLPYVAGCLTCQGVSRQFKLEPTWTYFLSVFWPVIDLTGEDEEGAGQTPKGRKRSADANSPPITTATKRPRNAPSTYKPH